MRSPIVKIIAGIVIVLLLVFVIRSVACSSSFINPSAGDPAFSEYATDDQQVTLRGFFLDKETSTDELARVYVVVGIVENGTGFTSIDSYATDSCVRFLSLDDTNDYSDVMSSDNATAFSEKSVYTCAYAYSNTIKGVTLTKDQTLAVAAFDIPQETLANASEVSIWFDICDALNNKGEAGIGYDNVILKFPTSLLTETDNVERIVARY